MPGTSVTPAQLQHALLLLVRQQGGEPQIADAASKALQQWRTANELHERAYQAALQAWHGTDSKALQHAVALPQPAQPIKRRTVRRAVVTALGLLSFGITGRNRRVGGSDTSRIVTTAQGELRSVALRDGSRVDIGAMTTLRLIETEHVRSVILAAGDIRLAVSKDPHRPFLVTTPFGTVTVTGTEFSVSVSPSSMCVAVSAGSVAVRADRNVTLTRGEAVAVDHHGLHAVRRVAAASVGAWRDGWLVFDQDNLLTAINRWNDYTHDIIRVDENDRSALRKLRITASFRFEDQAAFLASLPKIFALKITQRNELFWIARR